MAEILDIYDVNGNRTGGTIIRGEDLKEGQYHLAANIWVINSKKEVLIQKRAECKRHLPGIWATHGGCANTGENSIDTCIREANEEIGIVIDPKNVKPLARKMGENLIMDNYIVIQEFDISSAVLQPEEVSDIRWATIGEIEEMIKNRELFDYPEMPNVIEFIKNM